jgi:hypothetical protein
MEADMKLKKDWHAVPAGAIYPVMYPAGTELSGELLDRAQALGLVETAKQSKAQRLADEAAAEAEAKRVEDEAAAAAEAKRVEDEAAAAEATRLSDEAAAK